MARTIDQILDSMGEMGEKFITLEHIMPRIIELFSDESSQLRQLNKELGNGSKTTAALRGEIAKISRQTGIATRTQLELLNVTKQYHKGIDDTTKSTLKFIKASGASTTAVAEMTSKLSMLGKVSDKSFTGMYESILAVREQYGLTDDQINVVTETMTKYAIVTQKSANELSSATESIAKFTSQLTSSGVAIEDVSDIMDKIIDPSRATENLALLSKMGLSVNDIVSGDPTQKLEDSVENLKALGQQIANIAETNRFSAQKVAEVYGLTLEKAILLANMPTDEKTLNYNKKLDEYKQEMTTFKDSIDNFRVILGGSLSGPLSVLGGIFEKIGNTMSMLPNAVNSVVLAVLARKVLGFIREKIGDAAAQAGRRFTEPMKEYLDEIGKKDKARNSEIRSLTPNRKETTANYGWGWNSAIRFDNKKMAQERSRNNFQSMSSGERYEAVNEAINELNKIRAYGNSLASNSAEGKAFKNKYGDSRISDELTKLLNIAKDLKGETNSLEFTKNIKPGKGETLYSAITSELTKKDGKYSELANDLKHYTEYYNIMSEEGQEKIAEIITNSNNLAEAYSGILDVINQFGNRDDVNIFTSATNRFSEMAKSYTDELSKSTIEISDTMKEVNEFISVGNKKGMAENFKQRLGQLSQSFFGRIPAFLTSGFGNIAKGIGKFIFGGVTGIGLVSMLSNSLNNNEEYQKKLSNIGDKISGFMDSIIEKFGPAISGILNITTKAIDFISPVVEKIVDWTSKKVNKIVDKVDTITDSVVKIKDSYDKEELRNMTFATSTYEGIELGNIAAILSNINKNTAKTWESIETQTEVSIPIN